MDKIDSGFGELRDRVGRLEKNLAENTALTRELLEVMTVARNGLNFFAFVGKWLRKFVVWLGPFITIGAAIWALAHGRWPEIK
jgi:hypothetical protein